MLFGMFCCICYGISILVSEINIIKRHDETHSVESRGNQVVNVY